MVKLVAIRMLSIIAAQCSWKVHQINIKTVSLNGDIKIEVCMEKPQDSLQRVRNTGMLVKSLYDLINPLNMVLTPDFPS